MDEPNDVMQALDDEMVRSAAVVHRRDSPARPRRVAPAEAADLLALLASSEGRLSAPSSDPVTVD